MFAIVPYQVDVGMSRWPIANFLLILGIVAAQFLAIGALIEDPDAVKPFVLDGWALSQLLGHMFLHGGVFHLLGNMIFLWTFGNAVCAKVGNLLYVPLFLTLGVAAAAVHNLLGSGPAIGASGAINGVVGMYLIFYPLNNVSCAYWLIWRVGTFYLSSIWIILLYFGFDLWRVYAGDDVVAYWAHLGGFGAGVTAASLFLLTGFVEMTEGERSLLDVLGVTD